MSQNGKTANLELLIECEVKDKNGRILSVHRQQAKSLLKNFAKMLRTMAVAPITFNSSQTTSLTDTSGTSRTYCGACITPPPSATTSYALGTSPLSVNAGAGVDSYGIQVGTGASAVTRDDYQLGGKIVHGNASGQLSYGAMTVEDTDGTPPDTTFRVIRTFTNNTSSPITVYEIGLVIANAYNIGGTTIYTYYFLIARDVLTAPQSIPAGATLTVRYIFKVTA
jgi:hypothetical protein